MKKSNLKTLSLLLVTCLLVGCGQANVSFKNAVVISELGEKVSTDIYDYVAVDKDVPLEDAYVDTSEVDIYKVGTYPVTVKYLDSTLSFDVKVEDTTAPEVDVSDMEILLDSTVSANDIVSVADLSDTYTCFVINNEEVDSFYAEEIGVFDIEVKTKDIYNNETIKSIEITVYEEPATESEENLKNKPLNEEDVMETENTSDTVNEGKSDINPFFIPNVSPDDDLNEEVLEEGAYIDEETGEVVYTQYPMSMTDFFASLNASYTEIKSY